MSYEMVSAGDVEVVRITESKLSYTALSELQKEIDRRIEAGTRKMVVNLAPVAFVDSFAVGIIAEATRRIEGLGGELRLCGVGERVRMSLTITRLDKRVPIYPDEASALKSFGARNRG